MMTGRERFTRSRPVCCFAGDDDSMPTFRFDLCELPPETRALREEVRQFLREHLADAPPLARARSWGGWDTEFSRKVGARGWIGMTWPKRYGGHERTFLDRYVVLEEMLAAGAPVGAHWVADRQSGPLLLRFGTEAQRERFLPAITRGESYFAIGMSEPDSGSDLASLRTRAERVPGGYRVNGTKVWTSNAHRCQYMIGTFRTGSDPKDRHAGLTQFLVETRAPGITINPIVDLTGDHHFNLVLFEDVFVPEDMRVGDEGAGWMQVTTELAFERSGPERYLSSMALILELIRAIGRDPGERAAAAVGRLVAHLATLRQMSLSVSGMLQAGLNPNLEAAVVKDLGTTFEQEIPQVVHDVLGIEPAVDSGRQIDQVLASLVQTVPSFSLRGGTREVLRGIIARGLGLR
jgi:alkylation response protein AidB-like acyl-CoA dehydrogenase